MAAVDWLVTESGALQALELTLCYATVMFQCQRARRAQAWHEKWTDRDKGECLLRRTSNSIVSYLQVESLISFCLFPHCLILPLHPSLPRWLPASSQPLACSVRYRLINALRLAVLYTVQHALRHSHRALLAASCHVMQTTTVVFRYRPLTMVCVHVRDLNHCLKLKLWSVWLVPTIHANRFNI